LCAGCWWAGYFASRSGASVLLQSCFDGLGVSLVDRGLRWPSDLILKSSGPITFDSRLGVSSLVQVWFWALLGVLSVNQRLRGGGGCLIFRKDGCGSVWVMRTGFLLQGCSFGGE